MQVNLRTLGPNEAKVVLFLTEQSRNVVRAADIIEVLGSEQTARKVIQNLLKKGWLSRLIPGRYIVPAASVRPRESRRKQYPRHGFSRR